MRISTRTLIVGDDPRRLAAACGALLAEGCEPLLAVGADEARWRLQHDRPDAVFLDLTLPVLDGWALLAEFGARTHRPGLVAWMPAGSAADRDRAVRLGADAVAGHRDVARAVGAVPRFLRAPRQAA